MNLTITLCSVTLALLESFARLTLMTVDVDCSGNGRCVDGVNTFTCNCDPGFTGELCQTKINDCVGVDCSGNGQCVDGVNAFTCNCVPGYIGELCQTNIDDCVGVDCSRNGQCVDGVNSFTCECSTGFSGPQCSEGTCTHHTNFAC